MNKNEELKTGSLAVSSEMHTYLTSLVQTKDSEYSEDRPFTSIVEAFRFAFALGLSKGKRKSREGEQMTVAPRQFTVADYIELVEDEARKGDDSLGAIISDYAEGGADMMYRYSKKNKSILDMMN